MSEWLERVREEYAEGAKRSFHDSTKGMQYLHAIITALFASTLE